MTNQDKQKVISEYMADLGSRQWKNVSKEERSRRMTALVQKRIKKQKILKEDSNPEAEYAFNVYKNNKNK